MKRTWAVCFGSIAAVALFTQVFLGESQANTARPNVLFLMADDMRADMIGALGNPVIKTPNLDALARSAFVFRNAYCLGSNQPAVCFPSRCMLLSGRAYFREGVLNSGDPPNLPVSMKQAGYVTYHNGKSGNVAKQIHKHFDFNSYVPDQEERTSGEPGKILVDQTIAFLRERKRDKPFCLYLAFANPHDPRVAAQKYRDLYDREQIPLPRNALPLHPFDNGEMTVRDEKLAPWPRTPEEIRKQLHEYYAVISGMDFHLGRLLQSLKETGEFDNTVIIFSSDHGLAMGSHGLMGKQNLYEHSMKSPLLFAGPKVPRGSSDALVYLLDIFPTICELVGTEVPAGLDGKSLVSVMRGESSGVRETLCTAYRDVQRAIRDDRWKLIRYLQINQAQFFDLKNDPDERINLAGEPGQAARIGRLMELLERQQAQWGDKTPLTAEQPRDPTFTPPAPVPAALR